jgi:hypothetical protein
MISPSAPQYVSADFEPAAAEELVAVVESAESVGSRKSGKSGVKSVGSYRWKICALLFFATTLNYMDRQVLALLKPVLQDPTRGIGLTVDLFRGVRAGAAAGWNLCGQSGDEDRLCGCGDGMDAGVDEPLAGGGAEGGVGASFRRGGAGFPVAACSRFQGCALVGVDG